MHGGAGTIERERARVALQLAVAGLTTQMRVARAVVPTVTRVVVAAAAADVWITRATVSSALRAGATHLREMLYWLGVARECDLVVHALVQPVWANGYGLLATLGSAGERRLGEATMPRDTAVQIQSFGLAVQVVTIAQQVQPEPQNIPVVEGFVRSGTRIGALLERAMVCHGGLGDPVALQAAIDCIHETLDWLRVLEVSQVVTVPVSEPVYADCEALLGLLGNRYATRQTAG